MRRIGLAVVVAANLLGLPPTARAQPPAEKLWRVGVLMSLYRPDAPAPQAFRERLHRLGYVEGQNLHIEWRYAQGRDDRLPALAADLVRLKVDLLVADVTLATRAAMRATSTTPIVMATSADAVTAYPRCS
jgi:putative ABC transport system substrate-binding protein